MKSFISEGDGWETTVRVNHSILTPSLCRIKTQDSVHDITMKRQPTNIAHQREQNRRPIHHFRDLEEMKKKHLIAHFPFSQQPTLFKLPFLDRKGRENSPPQRSRNVL